MASSLSNWEYSSTHRLFVYGNLLDPEFFVKVARERFTVVDEGQEPPRSGLVAMPAELAGYEKWKPRDRSPDTKRRQGDTIEGVVIFRVTRPMLQMLDAFEGDHYMRRKVTVSTSLGEVETECYLALRDIPPRR